MKPSSNITKNAKAITVKSAPAARGTKKGLSKPPKVRYTTEGICLVSHTEFIRDVNVHSDKTTEHLSINPQRNSSFPWLSSIATRFEMFRFKKLKFMYKPSCGTSTSGYIVVGFDFDFYDDEPTKNAILAWKYSTKCALWEETSLDVSNDARMSTFRYNNYNSEAGDARLDFLGNLWLLQDSTSTQTVGEIFVTYEVEFRQPSLKVPPALYMQVDSSGSNGSSLFNTITKTVGNMLVSKYNIENLLIQDAGDYLIEARVDGTSITTRPDITFAIPSDSPGSLYEGYTYEGYVDTGAAFSGALAMLRVAAGPILIGLTHLSGTSMTAKIRAATALYRTFQP